MTEIEELKDEIKKLKYESDFYKNLVEKKGRLGLQWEEEPEKLVTDLNEKFPLLKSIPDNNLDNDDSDPHILIEGDNFNALLALNFTHQNAIDVIYIDPPFNTGARDWKYNNDYVDENHVYRHSRWLSFMQHRLLLAKNLLKDTGVICCAIDDYELPRLWLLLEKIFGRENHLGTVIIRTIPAGRKSDRKFALTHEYAIYFGKTQYAEISKAKMGGRTRTIGVDYVKDSDICPDNPTIPLSKEGEEKPAPDQYWLRGANVRKTGADSDGVNQDGSDHESHYPIYYDPGKPHYENLYFDPVPEEEQLGNEVKILPVDTSGNKRRWKLSKEKIKKLIEEGKVYPWETSDGWQIYYKQVGQSEISDLERPKTIWTDSKHSASEHGTKVLQRDLENKPNMFDFPKSIYNVEECIRLASPKNDALILDFFAGSGTTGRAVMMLNEKDEGKRRFILCTNNELKEKRLKLLLEANTSQEDIDKEGICRSVTYPRIKNLISGHAYDGKKTKELYKFELNKTNLKTLGDHIEKMRQIDNNEEGNFNEIKSEIKIIEGKPMFRQFGVKTIQGTFDGFGGNLKYFRIDESVFVPSKGSNSNLKQLSKNSVDLLCIKEDCFEEIESQNDYKIFSNKTNTKYLVIIYKISSIDDVKIKINQYGTKCHVYIFSYHKKPTSFFDDSPNVIEKMFPIPIWDSFESNRIDVQYLTSQHNSELTKQEAESQEAESQEADGEAEAEAPAVEEDQENGGNLWH